MAALYDLVIVGAGNLGLWTAYHLARQHFGRIAICEREWAGFGATSRSAGVVRQQGGSETAIRLGKWARQLYLELGEELGLDSGFSQVGYYVLAETDEEKQAFLDLVELRRRCGVANEWLDAAEGRRRWPWLNWERFVGATFTPDDGYVHPPIVVRNATYAVLRSQGIELFEKCPVTAIASTGRTYRIETARGVFEAERVLDAGGPRGARDIGALFGVDVPVAAARHQIVTFATVADWLPRPFPMLFNLAKGIYVRPEEQGALLGMSNPEERADPSERYQIPYDWAYSDRMRPVWESAFPFLVGQGISRAWSASIDYTPDHLPIVDQPRAGFYVLAAGGHGMMWGPALGLKMAELIREGAVTDLPADEITLARFAVPRKVRDAIALPFPTT
jgi:sarcosine oxidase subunit beta